MSCIFTPAQTLADFNMFSNCRKNDGSLRFLQMFVEVKEAKFYMIWGVKEICCRNFRNAHNKNKIYINFDIL